MRFAARLAPLAAVAFAPAAALAAPTLIPVAPGASARVTSEALGAGDFFGFRDGVPDGLTLVAERTTPLVVTLLAEDGLESLRRNAFEPTLVSPRFVDGDPGDPTRLTLSSTLRQRVLRDDADGTLTFAYDVAAATSGTSIAAVLGRGERLSVEGFGGLSVAALGVVGGSDVVERSADGGAVTVRDEAIVGSFGPTLIIDTDATAFGDAGTGRFSSSAESVNSGIELSAVGTFEDGPTFVVTEDAFFFAALNLDGLLTPAAAPVDGGGDPAVVPLPAGAWGGLATLGGAGLAGAARRRRSPAGVPARAARDFALPATFRADTADQKCRVLVDAF